MGMDKTPALKQVTTVTEGALMFGVSDRTIRKAIGLGRLSAEKSGVVHLMLVDDLIAYFKRKPQYIPERLVGFVES